MSCNNPVDPEQIAILKAFREASNFLESENEVPKDMVNKVAHYNHGIEVIDALESWDLNFSRSNVIKYLVRAGRKSKETELQDLLKSQYYLNREIERLRR